MRSTQPPIRRTIPNVEDRHCAVCGFPRATGSSCPACGSARVEPAVGAAHDQDPFKSSDDTLPQLMGATAAWKSREYPRYVGQTLIALGLGVPIPSEQSDGSFWPVNLAPAVGRPLSLLIGIDRRTDMVCVECAQVEIPQGFEAALLRAVLEVNAGLPSAFRLAARRERIVLRFLDSVAMVPPRRLASAIQDMAHIAKDLELVFRAQFPCKGLLESAGDALRRTGITPEVRTPPVEMQAVPRGPT